MRTNNSSEPPFNIGATRYNLWHVAGAELAKESYRVRYDHEDTDIAVSNGQLALKKHTC